MTELNRRCFSSGNEYEWEEERKLYASIINVLYVNKEKIKYIETKVFDNDLHFYFEYKNQRIEFSQYDWQRNKDSYNLIVGDESFLSSDSIMVEKYKPFCKYLYDKGFSEMCNEKIQQRKEIENKQKTKLKNLLNQLEK